MSIVSTDSKSISNSTVDWAKYRTDNFPVTRKWHYFDHAAVSPLPQPAGDAISKWLEESMHEGDVVWPGWAGRIEEIRSSAAGMVNAEVGEIAFVPSTTAGISNVAEGLRWSEGDNVVVPAGEFPSNLYPWMMLESKGVELRIVPTGSRGEVDLQQVADTCDSRTRLIAASWVGYATGYRLDPAALAQVAHDAGALFFLDAIQGLGVFPLDVKSANVDFFAADGHKWLMGPEGAGLFYCKQEHLESLEPRGVGWNSVRNPYDFSKVDLTLKPTASRYEGGTQNMAGLHGLGASIDLLIEAGLGPDASAISDRILYLTNLLCEKMEKIGFRCVSARSPANASGVVGFVKDGIDPTTARNQLLEQKVVASVRKERLRFSPHAYNNEEDLELVVNILGRLD